VRASYNDGRTARDQTLEVSLDGDALAFVADGEQRWPLAGLRAETLEGQVRLAPNARDAARLTVTLEDWRALTRSAPGYGRAQRRRRAGLVAILAISALSVAAVVFVVIPAASGPLARRTPPSLERQMGESFQAQITVGFPLCGGAAGQAALGRLGDRLGREAGGPFQIRVLAVHAPVVNAFALPGGTVMVTDRLIALAQSPDELSAVIAHEAAHVRQRHVMQAVWRSFGFGVLLDAMVGGGTGAGQQLVLLAGSITSLRYGREAETEADRIGQDLLAGQGLSSEGMPAFLRRLARSEEGGDARALEEFVADHPATRRRIEATARRARPGARAFTPAEWRQVRAACDDGAAPARTPQARATPTISTPQMS